MFKRTATDLDTQPKTKQQRLTCALKNTRLLPDGCCRLNNTGKKILFRMKWRRVNQGINMAPYEEIYWVLTFCWPCVMQWFLIIVQLDAQILFNVFIYLFIVLYMFRTCHAHHQEKQIVTIELLVIVTPRWWQCRVLVGSDSYQKLY